MKHTKTIQWLDNLSIPEHGNLITIKIKDKYITDKLLIKDRSDYYITWRSLQMSFTGQDLLDFGKLFKDSRLVFGYILEYINSKIINDYGLNLIDTYISIANRLGLDKVFDINYLCSDKFEQDLQVFLMSRGSELICIRNDINSFMMDLPIVNDYHVE